jgi:hypothetical protein
MTDRHTSLADRVDELADRFDAAWQSGSPPRIEDFVSGFPVGQRPALIAELVRVDLEYRSKFGQAPSIDQYTKRFPELLNSTGAVSDELLLYAQRVSQRAKNGSDAVSACEARKTDGYPTSVICPQCGDSISITESNRERIGCPSCGGSFRLDPCTSPIFPSRDLPRTLGKFQLMEIVGQGTFGTVYRARDVELGRTVAIKVPRGGSFSSTGEAERFLREARSAALLRHPNIVPVYEIARAGDTPYLVSDYVPGQTLEEVLNSRRLA